MTSGDASGVDQGPAGRAVAGRAVAAVLGGLLLAFLAATGARALNVPDEGRYAEVAREMLRLGDWVTPRLDGVPFLDKPPLFYWLEAGGFALFGVHVWSARLVPALLGFAGCAMVYGAGARLRGRRAGLLAALLLAANPYYFGASQYVNHDLAVATFITAAILAFALGDRSEGRARAGWLHAGYAAMGMAVMTKGLIGLVLPFGAVGLFVLATGRWRELARYHLPTGLLLVAAVAVPWHLVAQGRNPDLLHYLFVVQHFQRYAGSGFNNPAGPLFYPLAIAAGLLPWSPLLPAACARAWRAFRAAPGPARTELLLLAWPLVVVAFFSIPRSKIAGYALPALPPLALLAALELDARLNADPLRNRARRLPLLVSAAAMGVLGVGLIVAPFTPLLRAALSLPVAAWAALCGAGAVVAGIVAWRAAGQGRPARAVAAQVAFAAALTAGVLPALTGALGDTSRPLAEALAPRLQPGDVVACYRRYLYDLPVYLDRRAPLVVAEYWGDPGIPERDNWQRELWLGREWEPASRAWLVEPAELAARCRGARCFVLARSRDLGELSGLLPLASANGIALLATPEAAGPVGLSATPVPGAAGR